MNSKINPACFHQKNPDENPRFTRFLASCEIIEMLFPVTPNDFHLKTGKSSIFIHL